MKSENSRKDEQTQYLNAGLYNFNETVIKRMKHQSGTCFFMYVRLHVWLYLYAVMAFFVAFMHMYACVCDCLIG